MSRLFDTIDNRFFNQNIRKMFIFSFSYQNHYFVKYHSDSTDKYFKTVKRWNFSDIFAVLLPLKYNTASGVFSHCLRTALANHDHAVKVVKVQVNKN
jgi:hypothetical protein